MISEINIGQLLNNKCNRLLDLVGNDISLIN